MLGTQVANYRIETRLGEGGMGVVYKAIDLNLDRPVALKFLSAELSRDPGLIQRFQSEAKAQANLNHTNIATLYNFINVDGNWLIAMEYIDGETLEQMIRRAGALPHQEAIPLFKQALLGVGFAHRMGIVHRDLKPANIMVNRYGIVKVMDFGIAKALSARQLTRTGVTVGTVAYMSPEQIRNSGVDTRSDIYSLGVTLYEMLTARLPFNSDSDYQIQYDHVNTPPPPLTIYDQQIPVGIEAAVLRAMEKNPADRFAAVDEFGAALENIDVVHEKYQKRAQAPVLAVNPLQKTVVEAALDQPQALPLTTSGSRLESTDRQAAVSFMGRVRDSKFWASRNGMIAAVAITAVLAAAMGITLWPKSKTKNAPAARYYSQTGSGGASSPAEQNPPAHPSQESEQGQTTILDMQSDKAQSGSGDRPAVNRGSTSHGSSSHASANHASANHASANPESANSGSANAGSSNPDSSNAGSGNQSAADLGQSPPADSGAVAENTVAENKTRPPVSPRAMRSSVPNGGLTIFVRYSHLKPVGKMGVFGRMANNAMIFSSGRLTVSPSGSISYQCTVSPNPKGCEPPLSLARANIKSASLFPNGTLHIATFGQGNYDFYGEPSALRRARGLILSAGKQ